MANGNATTKKAASKKKTKKKKKPQYKGRTAGGGTGESIPTPNNLLRAMASDENVKLFVEYFEASTTAKERRGEISHQMSAKRNKLVDRSFNRRAVVFCESLKNLEPQHRTNMAITLYVAAIALAKMGTSVQKDLFLGGIMPELEEVEGLASTNEDGTDRGPGEPEDLGPPDSEDDEPEPLAAGNGSGLSDERVRELCEEHNVEWDPKDPGGTFQRLNAAMRADRGGAPAH